MLPTTCSTFYHGTACIKSAGEPVCDCHSSVCAASKNRPTRHEHLFFNAPIVKMLLANSLWDRIQAGNLACKECDGPFTQVRC